MATITLNIPDNTGVDLSELKAKIDSYTLHLISTLSHKVQKKSFTNEEAGGISQIFGAINITSDETIDEMREKALSEKYGL